MTEHEQKTLTETKKRVRKSKSDTPCGKPAGECECPKQTKVEKKKRAGNAYSQFVKEHFNDEKLKDLTSREKISKIAEMWREKKEKQ